MLDSLNQRGISHPVNPFISRIFWGCRCRIDDDGDILWFLIMLLVSCPAIHLQLPGQKHLSAFSWLPHQECGAERNGLLTVNRTGGTSAACIPAAALGRHGFLLCHEECVSSESKHIILLLCVLTIFFFLFENTWTNKRLALIVGNPLAKQQ